MPEPTLPRRRARSCGLASRFDIAARTRALGAAIAAGAVFAAAAWPASALASDEPSPKPTEARGANGAPLDHSGRNKVGTASFYHHKFNGRKMANGERFDPKGDNAASKTLPLGTKAQVTNLENGKTTNVTIEDRGPYVKGRIIDVTPATAEKLGIDKEDGLAKVKVTPIAVPQPDGSVKPGDAAKGG